MRLLPLPVGMPRGGVAEESVEAGSRGSGSYSDLVSLEASKEEDERKPAAAAGAAAAAAGMVAADAMKGVVVGQGSARAQAQVERSARDRSSTRPGAPVVSRGMTDHVLGIPYSSIKSVYSLAKQELGAGRFGVIRTCMRKSTGALFACKTVAKSQITVREGARV